MGSDKCCQTQPPTSVKTGKPPHLKVLATSTIGIVGASVVGRELIRLLQVFGCSIRIFDPFLSENEAQSLGVMKYDNLTEMMQQLDVLTIHTPLVDATRGQVQATHFQALPDHAIVINAARGECIVEQALITELEKGRLSAFLDVTSPEPAADDSPLRQLDNVVLTSHIAGPPTTLLGRQAVNDIAAFLAGDQPRHVITYDMLEHIA